ncbi:hypothetical protein BCR41DRAFT_387950 [Lobosporangium transversale]|uniref:Uncharacterized protein n=1 Tax=Lobosporangium transversale TaxID=64571 RepID=A0A1Y2GJ48_9FUNG|nr:hypothetical protein BCR41DRAFT_387950 [Lobosporangium transversale]ORZ10612.1 hypothetical protein BCR41DRAFT_387950 [Lobosporangium transversale]|eukprot:XP_021879333.1 hypothetical protein BCR41DRAFT_387950 [Lobosporangium transversale]
MSTVALIQDDTSASTSVDGSSTGRDQNEMCNTTQIVLISLGITIATISLLGVAASYYMSQKKKKAEQKKNRAEAAAAAGEAGEGENEKEGAIPEGADDRDLEKGSTPTVTQEVFHSADTESMDSGSYLWSAVSPGQQRNLSPSEPPGDDRSVLASTSTASSVTDTSNDDIFYQPLSQPTSPIGGYDHATLRGVGYSGAKSSEIYESVEEGADGRNGLSPFPASIIVLPPQRNIGNGISGAETGVGLRNGAAIFEGLTTSRAFRSSIEGPGPVVGSLPSFRLLDAVSEEAFDEHGHLAVQQLQQPSGKGKSRVKSSYLDDYREHQRQQRLK